MTIQKQNMTSFSNSNLFYNDYETSNTTYHARWHRCLGTSGFSVEGNRRSTWRKSTCL